MSDNATIYVHPFRLSSNMHTGVLYMHAFKRVLRMCRAKWYFVGDDDTLFSASGMSDFVGERQRVERFRVAYGNIYDMRTQNYWFTGGSGMALSQSLVQSLAKFKNKSMLSVHAKHCRCADVPLAYAIRALNGRMLHAPNIFMDSCMDCASRFITRPPVSCHAVTAYRSRNTHATYKGSRDVRLVEHRIRPSYFDYVFYKTRSPQERVATIRKRCRL